MLCPRTSKSTNWRQLSLFASGLVISCDASALAVVPVLGWFVTALLQVAPFPELLVLC